MCREKGARNDAAYFTLELAFFPATVKVPNHIGQRDIVLIVTGGDMDGTAFNYNAPIFTFCHQPFRFCPSDHPQ
jgi:hypothetical protein